MVKLNVAFAGGARLSSGLPSVLWKNPMSVLRSSAITMVPPFHPLVEDHGCDRGHAEQNDDQAGKLVDENFSRNCGILIP